MYVSKRVKTFQYLGLFAYLLFLAVPMLWMVSTAFKPASELTLMNLSWIPGNPTFDNFVQAWTEQPLARATLNSVIVSGTASVLTIIMAIPPAYTIARQPGALSRTTIVWVILSQMFPFILVAIPLYLTMVRLGLYDTRIGLIAIYVVWSLPFAIWMLRSYVVAIPKELEEAASIDGAHKMQVLRHVIAPLLMPGIVAAGMFTFVQAWNEFFFALTLIRDPDLSPLSVLLARFIGDEGAARVGPLAAASLIAVIPSLIFFNLMQKRLVSGILGGAVKG